MASPTPANGNDGKVSEDTTEPEDCAGREEPQKWKVTIRVYDISKGMAKAMSPMLLGKQIDGIWHTGMLVYGVEYFYGGGITSGSPEEIESTYNMEPNRIIELGDTEIPQDLFHSYLEDIAPQFTMQTYDLVTWNCNNFSDEVAKFLLGHGIPSFIIDLPKEALSTPMGQMILPMLQASQKAAQQEMAASGVTSLWTPGPTSRYSKESSACSTSRTNSTPSASATAVPSSREESAAESTGQMSSGSDGSSGTDAMSGNPTAVIPGDSSELSQALDLIRLDKASERSAKQYALNTIKTIIGNILRSPQEKKFRVLKKSNAALQRKILTQRGGPECLRALGFGEGITVNSEGEEAEEAWVYFQEPSEKQLETLKIQNIQIEEALKKLGESSQEKSVDCGTEMRTAPERASSATSEITGMMELMMSGNSQGANAVRQNSLMRNNPAMLQQAMQIAQSNPELMQQAMRMMGEQAVLAGNGTNMSAFASANGDNYRSQLDSLMSMGFSDETANLRALRTTNGNVNAAIEHLLNPGM